MQKKHYLVNLLFYELMRKVNVFLLRLQTLDVKEGTVTVIFLEVGKTTKQLGSLNVGDSIQNFAGPLGIPSEVKKYGTVVCVGGGVGIAPVIPNC